MKKAQAILDNENSSDLAKRNAQRRLNEGKKDVNKKKILLPRSVPIKIK